MATAAAAAWGSGSERPLVLKFGSSVLPRAESGRRAAGEVYRWVREGRGVVAVVSAIGETTDGLIATAGRTVEEPSGPAFADLLLTGEGAAAALLELALRQAGVAAERFDARSLRLVARGPGHAATPESVDVSPIRSALSRGVVAIVPGFGGVDERGGSVLLGRGGSDMTAALLGDALHADVVLLKDVDGLYERDPATPGPPPARLERVSWDEVERITEVLVQVKAVRFARERRESLRVQALHSTGGTLIGGASAGEPSSVRRPASPPPPPLRVALLGLGTVGLGVARRLADEAERFTLVGAAVRDPGKHAASGLGPGVLSGDVDEVLRRPHDVVVELIGGTGAAVDHITRGLRAGKAVVTANKAALATRWGEIAAARDAGGGRLRFSASVGGGTPVLETARRVASAGEPVTSVRGVINGTTNFILNLVAQGGTFAAALDEAQRLGYAEADPTLDLDGSDAAQKLLLISREVAGEVLSFADIRREGLDAGAIARAPAGEGPLRHVASLRREAGRWHASVSLERVPAGDALSDLPGATNRVAFTSARGEQTVVTGSGAGRWPTSESVMADLLELWRDHSSAWTAGPGTRA